DGAAPETRAAVPVQRDRTAKNRPRGLRRVVPRPRPAEPEPADDPREGPSPPHLASADELGGSAVQPDWWRVDSSPFALGHSVPGFTGGVEIPELLKPPPGDRDAGDERTAAKEAKAAEAVPAVEAAEVEA